MLYLLLITRREKIKCTKTQINSLTFNSIQLSKNLLVVLYIIGGLRIKVHSRKNVHLWWISTTLITLGTGTHMEWSTTPIEISLFIILQLLTINKPSALLHSLSRIAPSWVSFHLLSGDLYSTYLFWLGSHDTSPLLKMCISGLFFTSERIAISGTY